MGQGLTPCALTQKSSTPRYQPAGKGLAKQGKV
jgi:hypothetical protein